MSESRICSRPYRRFAGSRSADRPHLRPPVVQHEDRARRPALPGGLRRGLLGVGGPRRHHPPRSTAEVRRHQYTNRYRPPRNATLRSVSRKGGTGSAPSEFEHGPADGDPEPLLEGPFPHGTLVDQRAVGRAEVREMIHRSPSCRTSAWRSGRRRRRRASRPTPPAWPTTIRSRVSGMRRPGCPRSIITSSAGPGRAVSGRAGRPSPAHDQPSGCQDSTPRRRTGPAEACRPSRA